MAGPWAAEAVAMRVRLYGTNIDLWHGAAFCVCKTQSDLFVALRTRFDAGVFEVVTSRKLFNSVLLRCSFVLTID